MESLAIIVPFILIGGAGALVLFIVAVVQEGKAEHRGGFRQAFFTVVSLVMLTITVGSSIALLNIGFRQYVFRSATAYQQRFTTPPMLILPSQGGEAVPLKAGATVTTTAAYACTKDCQFTADDKTAVASWVTTYKQWQKEQSLSLATRRSLANALGFLIVGLPLFFVFFRLMQRGHTGENTAPSSPLRSLYFYGVAFAGLVMAVVATGIIINDGLNVWLKTGPSNNTISEPVASSTFDTGVQSVIACNGKCGFTSEQVALAHQWSTDNAKYQDLQQSNRGQFSSELAMALPFVIVGLPLFLYHFTTVRKETPAKTPSATL